MTFSIVARDPETGDVGVARGIEGGGRRGGRTVCEGAGGRRRLTVDAEPHRTGRWACQGSRQASTRGAILEALTSADDMASMRQAGIVDATGRAASYTGTGCIEWAGGRVGPGVAAQGNVLTGPEVVDALIDTYLAATGSFPERLLAALRAADQAGGDKRGRQSAALLVRREKGGVSGLDDRWIDLRVDDHTDPTAERSPGCTACWRSRTTRSRPRTSRRSARRSPRR